jgi:hypothetical protein
MRTPRAARSILLSETRRTRSSSRLGVDQNVGVALCIRKKSASRKPNYINSLILIQIS